MYNKNNKNGKILNVLLGLIALFIIIFIISWIVNKSSSTANNDATFKNNLEKMQEQAKMYFANELPKEIGDNSLVSLEEMYELDLVDDLTYGHTACDKEESYISITKINASEYKVKSNLVCGSKSDSITEKIKSNTIIDDADGNTILDEEKDNVDLEVETKTSSDGKKEDTKVNCKGIVCTIRQIETTCNTTYEYEYVKRNVSCPEGYTFTNGTCIKENTESINSTPNYSEEKLVIKDAKVNKGSSYNRYVDPIVEGGEKYSYCDKGTLKDGYCYEYANKTTTTTQSCPSGYTKNGNYCYKYTDLVTTSSTSCPSGYTKNGNYCYKYADIITNSSTSCPSGYTKNGNYCYKYTDIITNSTTTYSCSSGYTKTGSGANTKCVKTVNADKKYTAWGNPYRTYDSTTKESVYETEYEKKILVGQTSMGITKVYSYEIYRRTSYYQCSEGTLDGSTCKITKAATANTTTSTSCPSGYTKDGNTCYIKKAVTTNTSTSCPSGYTKDGSTCYIKKDLTVTSTSTCPKEYSNNGTNCVKKEVAKTGTTKKTYSCPAGYTSKGSGSSLQCYKTYTNNNTYYCEDDKATLKGKSCYLTVAPEYIGNTCPSGYSATGNICVKTVTETTDPIWTNSDYIYSKESFLEGYQKTGVAKFVTTCTPVEEIHYK